MKKEIGIYGSYADQVYFGGMSKHEAAYLARREARRNALINALEAIKHSSYDERLEADKILKQYLITI